jgi:DNA-binding CsgD family transcriptional regulator
MNHMQEAHTQNDLGSALRWSKEADPQLFVRLAAASALFWEDRGYVMEGRRWLAAALELLRPETPLRCAALYVDGRLALLQPDYASARRQLEAGLADARSMNDELQQSRMMQLLGLVAALMHDSRLSGQLLQASLEMTERLADDEALAGVLHHLGQSASLLGDDAAAQQHHARSLEIGRRLHNHRLVALAHLNLGTIALRRAELDSSAAHLAQSPSQRVQAPGVTEVRLALLEPAREYALELLEAHGEAEVAHRRHAAMYLTLMESIQPDLQGPHQRVWLARLDREHANVLLGLRWFMHRGEVEQSLRVATAMAMFWWMRGFAAARASLQVDQGGDAGEAGWRLAADGAAAIALEAEDSETSLPAGVTRRESEVLRLLAAGHTNKEIASELSLSVATVERHIANIYAKIGARGRADATTYAIARGLVSHQSSKD